MLCEIDGRVSVAASEVEDRGITRFQATYDLDLLFRKMVTVGSAETDRLIVDLTIIGRDHVEYIGLFKLRWHFAISGSRPS
jgi:hypothetical protein